ncbi:hypothetical protein HQN64_00820 [Enterobacteriaceae bacterium BIT-l23]|nr:hypothetical protein [Enterobacteriaceae bacterium BIT-l23]
MLYRRAGCGFAGARWSTIMVQKIDERGARLTARPGVVHQTIGVSSRPAA